MREMVIDNIFYTLLSRILRSNSWRRRIQWMSRVLTSFLSMRYLSAKWSVTMVIF